MWRGKRFQYEIYMTFVYCWTSCKVHAHFKWTIFPEVSLKPLILQGIYYILQTHYQLQDASYTLYHSPTQNPPPYSLSRHNIPEVTPSISPPQPRCQFLLNDHIHKFDSIEHNHRPLKIASLLHISEILVKCSVLCPKGDCMKLWMSDWNKL